MSLSFRDERRRTIRRLTPAESAWIVLLAGLIGYEIAAPEGQLLSELVHIYCNRPGWRGRAMRVFIAITAAHLADVLPPKWDPYHFYSPWFWPLRIAHERIKRRRPG